VREADAQLVLLCRAFEEADGEGQLLTTAQRARAGDEARTACGDEAPGDELLLERARHLLPALEAEVPQLQGVLSASRLGAGMAPWIVVLAAVVGFATNALGPDQRINILFAPLLGFVAWNLLVYVVLFVLWLKRLVTRDGKAMAGSGGPGAGAAGGPDGAGSAARAGAVLALGARSAGGFVARWAGWLVERALSRARVRQVRHQALIGAALTRYAASWRTVAVPVITARLHLFLHLGALTLVAATIGGMYVRGLGLEYRATWESTFLEAESVDRVLDVVLGPAARLLGDELPPVAQFRHPESEGDGAARWIHWYALTGLILVVLPRLLLAWWSARRARRMADDVILPLGGDWARRLLAPGRGGRARIDIQPCSVRLEPRNVERLASLLHDVFGARAEVALTPTVPYGEDPPALEASDATTRCRVLLFGLASTPESEVHGRMVTECAAGVREDEQLLVIVDGSSYAASVGAGSPRLDERRRAWDRVVREAGCTAVHVDLGTDPGPGLLESLGAGLYPAQAGGAA
jgi:hypothetical protein